MHHSLPCFHTHTTKRAARIYTHNRYTKRTVILIVFFSIGVGQKRLHLPPSLRRSKIMDQKTWLWKKRSAEKTLSSDKANNSITGNEETEVQELVREEEELERDLIISNKLSASTLSECDSKDCIAKKQFKSTQEAIAGWERAKKDAIYLKKDLDKVSQQKAASEERLSHLEAALQECMQQLHFVREEQERRIQSAVIKTSEEFHKTQIALNEKLVEASKRVAKLDTENTRLHKALSGKEKVIEELNKYRTQAEADLNALVPRVESTEKENASLKYEIHVLEKQLDIRNEEAEVDRRTADIAQKQQKESMKKIAKLESECQRLRLLVRRRLPGPATLTRMKNEVDMLGKNGVETRKRRSNLSLISSMEFNFDVEGDAPSKRINFLTEQLLRMEEENRSLQYALHNKSFKGQMNPSLATLSDLDSDDKASFAESSSASALVSEIQNFKKEKQVGTPSKRYVGITSEMNLMDDFAEMEKLAIVSLDYPTVSSHHSSEEGNAVIEKDTSTAKKNDEKIQLNMNVEIRKILELLDGINPIIQDNGTAEKDDKLLSNKSLASPTGYTVRAFQWKGDELSAILQKFYDACNDLLNGKADIEQFVQVVASGLEWVMNHCFSIQEVSSMKDAIRSHSEWDESRSESGEDNGSAYRSTESTRLNIQTEDKSSTPMTSPLNGHKTSNHMDRNQSNRSEEANNVSMGPANSEIFKIQYQDSKDVNKNLLSKKKILRQSIRNNGDQIEKPEIMKEGLENQLMETNLDQRKDCQMISDLMCELENTNSAFKLKDGTCNCLKEELKSFSETSKEEQDDGKSPRKQLRNDREIVTASEKLAECQETLLNLGIQLKAMASPRDAALFDKVISAPADHVITSIPTSRRVVSKRLSLQDKMLEEDNNQDGASTRTSDAQNGKCSSAISTDAALESWSKLTDPIGADNEADTTVGASMAIVPRKKFEGRSLWKKLFMWKKKSNRKKTPSLKVSN